MPESDLKSGDLCPDLRNGERMTVDDARRVLGRSVAFTAHGGVWVSGRLAAISTEPMVLVEQDNGNNRWYTLSTVEGWAAARR